MPEDIETFEIAIKNESIPLVNLLKDTDMISSVSEGNRLIKQGGIKINQEKVVDMKLEISKGSVNIYQVGKRKFLINTSRKTNIKFTKIKILFILKMIPS